MASKADRELKIAQEAARQRNLERASAQLGAATETLKTAQSGARTATGQTIFDKALAGLPSSYNKNTDVARGMAAMSARYGLQAADLNAYTGTNVGYNIAEQTKAEQQAVDLATSLVNQYSTPIDIPAEDPLPKITDEIADAFALLKDLFTDYGLEELVPVIEGYMKQGIGPKQAAILLKQEPVYKTRFAGNEKRRTSGLNVLSEAEYLALEDAYSQTLKAYGQQTYFGTDRKARQAAMSTLIGGDISATEFKDRIDLAVTRVANADPLIKTQLKGYYNIEDTDLVGYFLNPTQNLPKLEEKVKAAEIGSAAAAQNLVTSMATAEDLAKFGVDLATARKGYATIADILPTTTKLGQIYKEEGITYGQTEAESETFKGLASAQRKRLQLAQREIGTFSGQSGTNRISLSNKAAGQI
jgi:hypothetical protein